MLALTLDPIGHYLSVDTDEWLDDRSTENDTLTTAAREWLADNVTDSGGYATDTKIVEWLRYYYGARCTLTGMYHENEPASVSTVNHESFLENDISYVFVNVDIDGSTETRLMIVNGYGYSYASPSGVVVRDFDGDDDSEAFDYARGYASHDTRQGCKDWIIEGTVTLWPNGGGQTYRIDDCVSEDGEGNPRLVCPECGDTLTPYVD